MQDNVFEIASEIFGIDEEIITLETSPDTIDNWDSMNQLKLVTAIEEEFSINLSMAEIESIVNVKTLINVIQDHQSRPI
ncbi:hypothetical protein MNBD_GAMMA16-16 [hydrothermal vent metagenome]|uniref:Carrier domain-containing protein n=1 Tax=hydrothermal vent metagenome TaxID=652676 RepID=A0A3B0ZIG3_9ZZZZ